MARIVNVSGIPATEDKQKLFDKTVTSNFNLLLLNQTQLTAGIEFFFQACAPGVFAVAVVKVIVVVA